MSTLRVWLQFLSAIGLAGIASLCLHFREYIFPPPPGYSVAALGVFAVVMTLVLPKEPNKSQRVAWIVGACVLTVFEMWAISHDRKVQEANFNTITGGLTNTLNESKEALQKANANLETTEQVAQLTRENLESITGGESYCVLAFVPGQGFLVFIHKGEFPLYGVAARIVTLDQDAKLNGQNLGITLSVGDMIRGHANTLAIPIGLLAQNQNFFNANIFFTARNGDWDEQLRVKTVGGQFVRAILVKGRFTSLNTEEPLCETIDRGFPRDKNGNIDTDFKVNPLKLPPCE